MKFKKIAILLTGIFCFFASHCCVSSDVQGLAKKLKAMEKTLPLPYHESLSAHVNNCSSKPIPCHFESYSAFMETELQKRSMPLELKYLPFALSQMNPNFTKGDRRGYWSLPTVVALRYGLSIDAQNDERLDLQPSTRAALDYLSELNAKYNNWWLSILAFSNSPNALHHALMRSDDIPELWDFDDGKLLPNTNVIGDLIAYIYLDNQAELRFTQPIQKSIAPSVTEPKIVSQSQTSEMPKQTVTKQDTTPKTTPKNTTKPKQNVTYYTVKKGDTLTKIANKYHVTVNDLKKWNKLKNDRIDVGQKLTIKK